MALRVGLFGGSFNPIHFGHLIVGRAIREALELEKVIFLPSRRPPHKEHNRLANADHRAAMVRLAIEGEEGFAFDDFDLHQEPSYTIETVTHFQREMPLAEFFWFIGADSLMDLPTWHRALELVDLCTMVTAARSGQSAIDARLLEPAFGPERTQYLLSNTIRTPVIDISSTDIRKRVGEGRSIRYLVPESVRSYIERYGLYLEAAS